LSESKTNTAKEFNPSALRLDKFSVGGLCMRWSMSHLNEVSSSARPFSEERLLLCEFTHRINNELASAISLISIAAARSASDEVKAALTAVTHRLQNYARVHSALQMPEQDTSVDAGAYLRQLCQAISLSKLDSEGIELVLVERPIRIDSDRCWRLGLIVSELITNSARHAFIGRGGVIRVELSPSRSFVECSVADNGAAETDVCPGRGLKIVQALAKGLDAKIDQHFGSEGTTSVIIFPASS
jgi:two-component sensor histidine kinase